MKNKALIFGMFALLMFAFSPSYAQRGMANGYDKEASQKKRMEKMKDRLNLTDSQVTQIEAINATYHGLIKEAKEEEYDSQKEKMQAIRELRKEQDEKVTALLDENQKTEWAKMKKEMREKMKENRGKRKGRGNRRQF